jgi:hypothetical protein
LGGALLFDKKTVKVLLFSGLECGMFEFLHIFFSQAVVQRAIVDFPAFLETDLAEKIAVCDHTTRDPNK